MLFADKCTASLVGNQYSAVYIYDLCLPWNKDYGVLLGDGRLARVA